MLHDYKKQGTQLYRSTCTLLITQEEWDTWANDAKGFTRSEEALKLWVIRQNTVFPVEILTLH